MYHHRLSAALVFLALSALLPAHAALAADPPAAAAPTAPAQPASPAKPEAKPKPLSKSEEKKAIAALPPAYREWLEEIALLISPQEKATFLRLDKDYERDSFIERFWESRSRQGGILSA